MAQSINIAQDDGHSLIEVLVALCLLSVIGLGLGFSGVTSQRMARINNRQLHQIEQEAFGSELDSVQFAPFTVSSSSLDA